MISSRSRGAGWCQRCDALTRCLIDVDDDVVTITCKGCHRLRRHPLRVDGVQFDRAPRPRPRRGSSLAGL